MEGPELSNMSSRKDAAFFWLFNEEYIAIQNMLRFGTTDIFFWSKHWIFALKIPT